MTLDEALENAVLGMRVTASCLQDGCYVEHTFARGYLLFFPSGSNCDFHIDATRREADWTEYGGELAEDLADDCSDNEPEQVQAALRGKINCGGNADMLIGGNFVGKIKSFDMSSGWSVPGQPAVVPKRDGWSVPDVK